MICSPSQGYLDWRRNHGGHLKNVNSSPSDSRTTWNHYVLESESSQNSDDGSDTALSIQGKETGMTAGKKHYFIALDLGLGSLGKLTI